MPNRKLTPHERSESDILIQEIRSRLGAIAGGDAELLFALRRRLIVRLTHDERGTPTHRNKLKAIKRIEQNGSCAICGEQLPDKYAELDRFVASKGYTPENTRLVHHECHTADQAAKAYL
jgi:hypothetical protein